MKEFLAVFVATCRVLREDETDKAHPLSSGMRPNLRIAGEYAIATVEVQGNTILPGESGSIDVRAILTERAANYIEVGQQFALESMPNPIALCSVKRVVEVTPLPTDANKGSVG